MLRSGCALEPMRSTYSTRKKEMQKTSTFSKTACALAEPNSGTVSSINVAQESAMTNTMQSMERKARGLYVGLVSVK